MNQAIVAAVALLVAAAAGPAPAADRFTPVSGHCYFLPVEETGWNIAAVVTGQGTLLFDPPPEPDLTAVVSALERIPGGSVRWMVRTGFSFAQTAGVEHFAREGAVMLSGFRQQEPLLPPAKAEGAEAEGVLDYPRILRMEPPAYPLFTFKREMYLYPDDLEIRIQALPHAARTVADIVAYVPDEKVLFAGSLFEASRYPDIDASAGGSASGWIDALEEVIGSIPLLIPAIPDKESAVSEQEEKTPEELVSVVSGRGEVSNLQSVKDVLEAAKGLRRGVSRAVGRGQSCQQYLDSQAAARYRIYGNFYPFGAELCRELSRGE